MFDIEIERRRPTNRTFVFPSSKLCQHLTSPFIHYFSSARVYI